MSYQENLNEQFDERLAALEKAVADLQKRKGGGRPVAKRLSASAGAGAAIDNEGHVDTPAAPTWNPVAVFCEEFRKLYHNQYQVDGRDARSLTTMAKGVTEAHWRGACKAFLFDANPSKFTIDTGHSVIAFYNARNKFLAEGSPR